MASSLHDVVELVSNNMAFVAIVADGHSVVTWGNAECGGLTSDLFKRSRLKQVQKVAG